MTRGSRWNVPLGSMIAVLWGSSDICQQSANNEYNSETFFVYIRIFFYKALYLMGPLCCRVASRYVTIRQETKVPSKTLPTIFSGTKCFIRLCRRLRGLWAGNVCVDFEQETSVFWLSLKNQDDQNLAVTTTIRSGKPKYSHSIIVFEHLKYESPWFVPRVATCISTCISTCICTPWVFLGGGG